MQMERRRGQVRSFIRALGQFCPRSPPPPLILHRAAGSPGGICHARWDITPATEIICARPFLLNWVTISTTNYQMDVIIFLWSVAAHSHNPTKSFYCNPHSLPAKLLKIYVQFYEAHWCSSYKRLIWQDRKSLN